MRATMSVVEYVLETLRREVHAALAWINAEQRRSFEVTGKFWRSKGFALQRRGPDDVASRAKRAMAKLALFVAGWVALALLVWAALAAPGIVAVHRSFQSV